MFPTGSSGGCYLIQIGEFLPLLRSNLCVSSTCLIPNGRATNYVLEVLVDDLLSSVRYGVISVECDGIEYVLYVDVAAFVGYYPASSTVIDNMVHGAVTLSTHCVVKVLDESDAKFLFKNSHSTRIHIANSTFARGPEITR